MGTRFEVKARLGYDINTNKQIRKSVYSTISLADAQEKALKLEEEYARSHAVLEKNPLKIDTLTFNNFAAPAVEAALKNGVKGKTLQCDYIGPLKSRICPFFGDTPLNDILVEDVQQYINKQSHILSSETVKKDIGAIKLVFRLAANRDSKYTELRGDLKIPKYARKTPTMHCYNEEEFKTVSAFAATHQHGLPVLLALHAGLTLSEVFGIDFENVEIDDEEGVVRLRIIQGWSQDYVEIDGEKAWVISTSDLKNEYRHRYVPIYDPVVIGRIKSVPRKIEIKRKGKTVSVCPTRLCYSATGLPVDPSNWESRYYKKFKEELHCAHPNIPLLKFHELRHSAVTHWRRKAVRDNCVEKLAGWNGSRMMARYDHVFDSDVENELKDKL